MSQEHFLSVILSPHLSEKAAIAAEKKREYVFEVKKTSTKQLVKKAVESLFEVDVLMVRIVNVKTKAKRFGGIKGYRKAWKKAYVTLREGQQIVLSGSPQ